MHPLPFLLIEAAGLSVLWWRCRRGKPLTALMAWRYWLSRTGKSSRPASAEEALVLRYLSIAYDPGSMNRWFGAGFFLLFLGISLVLAYLELRYLLDPSIVPPWKKPWLTIAYFTSDLTIPGMAIQAWLGPGGKSALRLRRLEAFSRVFTSWEDARALVPKLRSRFPVATESLGLWASLECHLSGKALRNTVSCYITGCFCSLSYLLREPCHVF
jgi:hypothetical protein